jgi:zinc finger SWIM domain-containing protein 3
MYKKRRLWPATYLTEGFWLGMKSNQRSESLNSCLHLHLDGEMTVVDMILHYENVVVHLRENEARDDCAASQTIPVPVTSSRELEVVAARVFTPANIYRLQEDLKKVGGMKIAEIYIGDMSEQFVLSWKGNPNSHFWMEYTPTNSAETIRSSCRRMVRKVYLASTYSMYSRSCIFVRYQSVVFFFGSPEMQGWDCLLGAQEIFWDLVG